MNDLLIAALIVAAAAYALNRRQSAQPDGQSESTAWEWPSDGYADPSEYSGETSQETNLFEDAAVAVTPSTYTPANVSPGTADRNIRAFLGMIAYAEGTSGPDGYRTLFGYGKFDSYADHPRIYVPFGQTTSSAAGRYQILARTWDGLRTKLSLKDFSPASQDAAAIELIRQRGALADVQAGRVTNAIFKVRKVWASLPGAGYGQGERSISTLIAAFNSNGGTFTA